MNKEPAQTERLQRLSPTKRALLRALLGQRCTSAPVAGTSRRLAAFVTLKAEHADAGINAQALREALAQRLPDYMVPTTLAVLDAFPRLPNGKIDTDALRRADPDMSPPQETLVAPRNERESRMAAIWADVLRTQPIGVHDNFFELGGDSILSIKVVSRANQQGFQLAPQDLFEYPTIAMLAANTGADAVSSAEGAGIGKQAQAPGQSARDGDNGDSTVDFPDAGLDKDDLDRFINSIR